MSWTIKSQEGGFMPGGRAVPCQTPKPDETNPTKPSYKPSPWHSDARADSFILAPVVEASEEAVSAVSLLSDMQLYN